MASTFSIGDNKECSNELHFTISIVTDLSKTGFKTDNNDELGESFASKAVLKAEDGWW